MRTLTIIVHLIWRITSPVFYPFLQFPCQHSFVVDPAVCSIDHCNYYYIIAHDELVTLER